MSYFKNKTIQHYLDTAKAVIFDMNGLLINDEKLQLESVIYTLKKSGLKIKLSKKDWITKYVGRTDDYLFNDLFYKYNLQPETDVIKKLIAHNHKFFFKLVTKNIKKITRKGIIDFIEYLSKNKYKIALATSAGPEEVEIVLGTKGLNIKKYFKYTIDRTTVKHPKPNPEIYTKTIKKLHCRPEEILIFEDTALGIESGKKAGAIAIAIPTEFTKKQNFNQANLVVNNLTKNAKEL